MNKPVTAEDLLPLIAGLTSRERARLLRLIADSPGTAVTAATAYAAAPPRPGEFADDDETLEWESGGWDTLD